MLPSSDCDSMANLLSNAIFTMYLALLMGGETSALILNYGYKLGRDHSVTQSRH